MRPNVYARAWIVAASLGPLACGAGATTRASAPAQLAAVSSRESARLEPGEVDRLLTGRPSRDAKLTLVFVLDGLRPDGISADLTPNLHALRAQGVSFQAGHAIFPTVTRVNAAALATGRYPAGSGIGGNIVYAPPVDPNAPISTGDYERLRALDRATGNKLLLSESLGEILARNGKRLAVVSSSGNGCALLLNHRAPEGVGVLINGFLEPGKLVAFPSEVHETVVSRFGHSPPRDDVGPGPVDWAERVLREYVLPELAPDVIINWLTQPDGAQHKHGVHSPEADAAIHNDDRQIGLVLQGLRKLGLFDRTNIFVLSDHGFSQTDYVVNLAEELVRARLKASVSSTDVVVASNAIHVQGRERTRIAAIAQFLQRQPWTEAIFTHPAEGPDGVSSELGFVPGTYSLELAQLAHPERGPDLVIAFPWSSAPNRHGAPGRSARDNYGAEPTGPRSADLASHGNLSPSDVRNTWIAWGVDIKDAVTSPVPVANVDLLPTILSLLGLPSPELDGRVVAEALEGGPEPEKVPVRVETYVTSNPETGYRAALQVSYVGSRRYLDKIYRF